MSVGGPNRHPSAGGADPGAQGGGDDEPGREREPRRDDEAALDDAALCIVLCTAPEKDAARLARGLVQARLAACVARVPGLVSVYQWKGETHEDAEVQLVVKTTRARFPAVRDWLGANHPYEVPEILCVPVLDASAPYAAWVRGAIDDA